MIRFILIVILIILSVTCFISLDPDFGWHIQMGKLILHSGIPKTDPFSYTMPSFPFIDHEWLSNVIFFKIYSATNKTVLAFIFAFLSLFSLIITFSKKEIQFTLIPLLLSFAVILPFAGIRPQVESWVMLAVLLKILSGQKLREKWRFTLPFFFILWTNLHGSFAIGIVILTIFNFTSFLKKALRFTDLIILFLSTAATLLNPYGIRIWQEVLSQISDSNLHLAIKDWFPMIFKVDPAFLILLTLSFCLILRYKNKFSLFEKIIYLGLLFAGLSSQRHIPLWTIATMPLFIRGMKLADEEFMRSEIQKSRFKKVSRILLISVIFVCIFSSYLGLKQAFSISEDKFYPKKAINFLKILPEKGQLFAIYDWGGYLIWKLPERKVFIDGRMPSWRRNLANHKESNNAFAEYGNILNSKDQSFQILNKYNVQYILRRNTPVKFTGSGWEKIYQDPVSVIYKRNSLLPAPPRIGESISPSVINPKSLILLIT